VRAYLSRSSSITYRIAAGKQQGRKVFTLQSIAPMAEHGLASGCSSNVTGFSLHAGVMGNAQVGVNSKGCAVTYFEESPTLGDRKKGW
jgi:hypothetical protein